MSRGSLADTRKAPTCVSAGQRLACSLSQQCPEGDLPEQSIWGYAPLLKCYWAALWRDEDHPQVRESHHAQAHLLPHPDIRAVTNHGRGRGSWARPTCGSPHSWGQRPHQGPVSHTTLRDAHSIIPPVDATETRVFSQSHGAHRGSPTGRRH